MNDDQLEMCLRNMKSSACEPDKVDAILEEQILGWSTRLKKGRRSRKQMFTLAAIGLLSATGFVALGGDSVVMNYIAPSQEKDANGNPVPYDFRWGDWMHKIHDHVWDHFKSRHGM